MDIFREVGAKGLAFADAFAFYTWKEPSPGDVRTGQEFGVPGRTRISVLPE